MAANESIKYVLIVFINLFSFSLVGQNLQDFSIKNVKNVSDSLYQIKETIKADSLLYVAEKFFRDNDMWDNWYIAISLLRNHYQRKGDFVKTRDLLEGFEKLLPESESFTLVKLKFKKAYNFEKLIEYNSALKEYKKALILLLSMVIDNQLKKTYLIKIYKNISINSSRLGDQESAIKYCDLGIEYCFKHNLQNELCDLYINKGQFYFYSRQNEKAIFTYNEAFKFCETNYTKSFNYISIAEIYLKKNDLKNVIKYLDLAKKQYQEEQKYFSTIYGYYLFNIGETDKGKRELVKAIDLTKKYSNNKSLIKEIVNLALLLYKNNEKDEALFYAHKGLCQFYTELDSLKTFERPATNEKLPYTYIIEALYIKAKYFRDKYLETNDEFSLGEATFYYDLLLSHFDKLKSEYYSSSSQYRMGAYSQKIYSEIISFYVDQFNKDHNKDDLKNAFSLAQRANSFVLRNAVSDRKALELAGVQQDSLEEYLQLASKVASDASKDSTGDVSVLIEFDDYKESLLSNYPSYGKYNKEEEISIEKLMSSLGPKTLVLKYYYFNEVMTVIGVSKDLMFAENIPFTEEMDSIINSNLEILSQSETNNSLAYSYMSNSKKVYDLVIGDLLEKYDLSSIDHLTIIPDGSLKKVAFNALAINDTGDWNDPSNYLMSKYAVNYLYYCSQLNEEVKAYKSKDGFIGFGIEYEDDFLNEIINDYMSNFKDNVDNSRSISLSPLTFADDEVITSAEILNGTSYINADVTPTQVFSTINDFDVVHFSAHAFVDEEDYLNSFVVLNKDEGENYQLKYSDILNLDIDSELVVLSACQTSSGKSVSGEGLMSLSRAFVQSGGKSTVGAYWNAPDYATKELMTLFYSNLKEGMTKSKAMQQAQIEYLTNDKISSPTIRSPFFWASWALYGNDKPLNMSSSLFDFRSWTTYGLLSGIVLIIALLFMYVLKRNRV